MSPFDVLIIGSGPGGYVAAIRAAQLGLKTAIVEREQLGGVCLNWGCIPTKALLKSAQAYSEIRKAQDYGIGVKGVSMDFERIVKRSRNIADSMHKGVQFLLKKNKVTVLKGIGKLQGKGKVTVKTEKDTQTYETKHILLATGARARSLSNLPADGQKIITYREAMTLKKLPKTLLVVGSGAIGMEFAYFYHTLGTQVTVIEALNTILPNEDKDVSGYVQKHFQKLGISFITSAKVETMDTKGKTAKLTLSAKQKKETLTADHVLLAIGISPNTENLGLEEAGVKLNKSGRVEVGQFYETSAKNVFAIGDLIPGPALAHVASAEGICCVEHLAGLNPQPIDYGNIPSCTYTQPEIASIGLTEAAAKEQGYKLKVGTFPLSASGKAKASGHSEGFVKMVYDAKYGELLGAHMVGEHVTEMIAEISAAKRLETTGTELIKTIHPHPTLSEAVMEATAQAYGEAIHL